MHQFERRLAKLEPPPNAARMIVAEAATKEGADKLFAEHGAGTQDLAVWIRLFDESRPARFLYAKDLPKTIRGGSTAADALGGADLSSRRNTEM